MKNLFTILTIALFIASCTKEKIEPVNDCQPIMSWLDTYSKDNVWLFTDTCKYYGVLCGIELQSWKDATKIQSGLCDNDYNRYVRIEIGGGNKEKHQIFK